MATKISQLHPVERETLDFITSILKLINAKIYIAYSGGMDSAALLHSYTQLSKEGMIPPAVAWHINHNISDNADAWQEHCRLECAKLKVKIKLNKVRSRQKKDESMEIYARRCRYAIWQKGLKENDILLQAHHQRDQAETLLLRLARGSPNLKGIPELRYLGKGYGTDTSLENNESAKNIKGAKKSTINALDNRADYKEPREQSGIIARPFLKLSKEYIKEYVTTHNISFIEDEANADLNNERSYIRHKILPPLSKKWKSATKSIALSAQRLEAYNQALPYAQKQLLLEYGSKQNGAVRLNINAAELSPQLFEILLRGWLASLPRPLPPPPAAVIDELRKQVKSPPDKMPLISWENGEIRRYRNYIYAMAPIISIPNSNSNSSSLPGMKAMKGIRGTKELKLSAGKRIKEFQLPIGKLIISRINKWPDEDNKTKNTDQEAETVYIKGCNTKLLLKFRQGGESIRLAHPNKVIKGKRRELKKLFQEKGVLPWRRELIPLIYTVKEGKEELIAVPGIGVAKGYAPVKGKAGLEIIWQI